MRAGYLISMLTSVFLLTGCSNLYDRYFTAEGKFYNRISGLYNQGGTCDYNTARLLIADYIELDGVACRMSTIEQTDSEFLVTSIETCLDRSSQKRVPRITWAIRPVNDNKIIVKINNQEPQSFQRCG